MTDEEVVKQEYPDAVVKTLGWATFIYAGKALRLVGVGESQTEAWADARRRIQEPRA